MAHQAVKLYSILLYLLGIVGFFFLGIIYAVVTEAAKGQMLAGGAIILGYGIIGALTGLCVALIMAFKSNRGVIIKMNVALVLLIAASITYFTIRHKNRQQEKLKNSTDMSILLKKKTSTELVLAYL